MPVNCHQCGEPIDMLAPTLHGQMLHFHARCYTEFQEEQQQYQAQDDPRSGRRSLPGGQGGPAAEDTQLGF